MERTATIFPFLAMPWGPRRRQLDSLVAKGIWVARVAPGVALADILELPPVLIYLATTVTAFLESAPAFGLLMPGQVILFGAGFLSGEGHLDPFILGATILVGGFCGDAVGFVLGRRWGVAPLERLPGRLKLTAAGRERLEALFENHGVKSIVLARFQPVGRAFGPYLAGATGMPPARFLLADLLASTLAAGSLVALGYLAGLGFERLSKTLGFIGGGIVTALLIAVVFIGLRLKRKAQARVAEHELAEARMRHDEDRPGR
jgi:membrane-associated protein